MYFLDAILSVIFPVRCISCKREGLELCMDCIASFPIAERETPEWIIPMFDYRHPSIKKSIWFLKYKGKKRLALIFAEILHERIIEELADLKVLRNFHDPILVPIPLSKERKKERKYNQTELICEALIQIDKKSGQKNFDLKKDILIKTRETEHQARIKDRSDRLKNLMNSFAVKNEQKIKGRNVILIDDVTTTGTTLSEAKRILKNSGAKNIIAFTIAH
ncbi:MAG: phosphoribosyltransferase family protein [Patescibacteria group bacterium]